MTCHGEFSTVACCFKSTPSGNPVFHADAFSPLNLHHTNTSSACFIEVVTVTSVFGRTWSGQFLTYSPSQRKWVICCTTLCRYSVHFILVNREKTMTAAAMEMSLNKRFNEQNNSCAWCYKSLYMYVSLSSSAKQQREMTKICVVWRMWTINS